MGRTTKLLLMIDEAGIGGGQMHVLLLARHLKQSEFDVTIATEANGYLVDEARRAGIRTMPIAISNAVRFGAARSVARALRADTFDILHTHGGTAGFWGRSVSLALGLPRVRLHTYHGLHYLHDRSSAARRYAFVDRRLLSSTARVVCVCEADRKKAIAARIATEEKAVVIYNGIEAERFNSQGQRAAVRSRFGAGADTFVFLCVGRLHKQKGHAYLIRAFAQAAKNNPHIRLWLAGDGDLRDELHRLAHETGTADQISFLGAGEHVPDLLAAADAFVLASLWEGQPLALLEAMAAAKPVIATAVDGVPEIVKDGESGLLVQPRDVPGLARALMLMVSDDPLRRRLEQGGHTRLTTEFTAQTMAHRTAQLYRSIIS